MTAKTPREVMSTWFDRGPISSPDALAGALIGTLSAAGFVIVPREPTEKMIGAAAYEGRYVTFAKTYRAMLAAAEEKPADGK